VAAARVRRVAGLDRRRVEIDRHAADEVAATLDQDVIALAIERVRLVRTAGPVNDDALHRACRHPFCGDRHDTLRTAMTRLVGYARSVTTRRPGLPPELPDTSTILPPLGGAAAIPTCPPP